MKCILIALFTLFATQLTQAQSFRFNKVTSNNGLSQSEVYSFLRDNNGFMWIGTLDGLNCFDGYSIRQYNVGNSSQSLSNNTIRSLAQDKHRRIWIGTDDGLNVLLPDNQCIYQIKLPFFVSSFFQVLSLYIADNILWMGTSEGLLMASIESYDLLDIERNIKKVSSSELPSLMQGVVINVTQLSDKSYMVCGNSRTIIFSFDPQKSLFTELRIPETLSEIDFSHVAEDSVGNIWLARANYERGVIRINKHTHETTLITASNDNFGLSSNHLSALSVDAEGNVWIATTDAGINLIRKEYTNNKKIRIEKIRNNLFDPNSLSSDIIYSIYTPPDGTVWIGTLGSGVNTLSLYNKRINSYRIPPLTQGNKQNSNFIRALCPDYLQENILIGTQNDGLYSYNIQCQNFAKRGFYSQSIFHITPLSPPLFLVSATQGAYLWNGKATRIDQVDNSAFYATRGDNNCVWVGGYGGLYRLCIKGTTVAESEHYTSESSPVALSVNNTRVLFYDSHYRQLWVGTQGGGLNILNLDTLQHPIRNTIYRTNSEQNSISSNYVRSICQTARDTFWVGTYNGLNRVVRSPEDGRLKFYPLYTTDGLPNNMIQNILNDHSGNLWISTNFGLVCFNPTTYEMNHFGASDGLQSNEFSEHVGYLSDSGEIFFGGINGFNSFFPNEMIATAKKESVVITEFYLNNELVEPNKIVGGKTLLSRPIFDLESITLRPKENNFRFRFSAMNFTSPQKIKYAYLLEGHDKKWNVVDANNRSATYTNIAHGRYSLHVKASNSDGEWSDNIRTIQIHILTPFYLTWYAYSIYTILAFSILLFITRFSVIRIATKKKITMEAEHKERLHELDTIRTRFFINISHDLRTPLTLITGPLSHLLTKHDIPDSLIAPLQMVERNANKLKYMIEQLLDFRKMEVGHLKPRTSMVEINGFVRNEVDHFEYMFNKKQIHLKYDFRINNLVAKIDAEKVGKILFNLVSNAIKYTYAGTVTITIDTTSNNDSHWLIITVTDTGVGIPNEKLTSIFNRFYNDAQTNHTSSYGIGLSHCKDLVMVMNGTISVISEVGRGSAFTVSIPIEECVQQCEMNDSTTNTSIPLKKRHTQIEKTQITDKLATVLVIEDNSEMRAYIKSCIEDTYRILEACNGKEGMCIAKDSVPDLVLSDLIMPEMDGFELCNQLKNTFETSHIPIIIITSNNDHDIRLRGIQIGADDYISKPFETDYLLVKIESLIKGRITLRQRFRESIQLEPTNVALTSLDQKFIEKLISIIEIGIPDSSFTVDSLEREMAMGHAKFYNKVKHLTGMSGKEFLQNFRMKRAAQILLSSDLAIADVAYQVGFNDPKYFTVCFRQRFDMSPSEYKKREGREKEK